MTGREEAKARTPEALLAERIGLDPQTVGASTIARALEARMSALGLSDRQAYLRQLDHSEDEQQELIEEVVIPESWFFRDDRPFAALRAYVSGRADSTRPLRVLSIPCACGEEPYSIAMTLLDLGLTRGRFQIDAVDVSARHLAIAERGVYRQNSFRGNDLAFRDRHFHPGAHGQVFTLDPSVRATVRFSRGNLLDPRLLGGEPPYDIIYCRNLLIYLDPAARHRALNTFDRLLGPEGLLFVGHAERLAVEDPRFDPWGENADFALRRRTSPRAKAPAWRDDARRPAPPRRVVSVASPPRPSSSTPATPHATVPPPRPATSAPPPESPDSLLDEAAALADQGRHDEASACCEEALGRFGPSARAFFLLGLVRQAEGRLEEAEACFRKVIYLDPVHDEALLALALGAQRRGDTPAAAGYRRRAERARARKGTS